MVPVTEPPPKWHVGSECCKCKASSFAGRRYACWQCANYQLCGTCYDSGDLPAMPGHMFYHHLDVHYTLAEYELYFGGEPYQADKVPQSYKCAMCDMNGLDLYTLEAHVNSVHAKHGDYFVYSLLILARRKAADEAAMGFNLSVSQSVYMRLMRQKVEKMRVANFPENYHTVSSMPTIKFELPNRSNDGSGRGRVRRMNMEPPSTCDFIPDWAHTSPSQQRLQQQLQQQLREQELQLQELRLLQVRQLQQQQHYRSLGYRNQERLPWNRLNDDASSTICYADVLRGFNNNANTTSSSSENNPDEKNKTGEIDNLNVETNKFLCAPFLQFAAEAPLGEQPPNLRGPFIEALLCSMLADEELSLVAPLPTGALQFPNQSINDANQDQKWFSEFVAGNEYSMTVPEMISDDEEATQHVDDEPCMMDIDSDMYERHPYGIPHHAVYEWDDDDDDWDPSFSDSTNEIDDYFDY
ncbi:E3 ubiquitin-protein ligase KCMF1-like [Drosophila grimshawi]|uniref:E3 ubiquitin-protein ligase KCMF1-like n=1 Tax=Drosophila grimshawi TaxID=7222 RepID=UPI000C8709D7|nr:E3 ubiquitin-protein ligase KCMF1-like [Drosophila grimshawi]XP_032591666.1 E3 ubiquitin-protein ligase KCMF1-like [Drosophila grimshawi]